MNEQVRADEEDPNFYNRFTNASSAFISDDKQIGVLRHLKKIDIFSFIPVPKDHPVSTRRSIIGSSVFFLIFIGYVIFDFAKFLIANPGISQTYYTKLDNQKYPLPRFGMAFMQNQYLNYTQDYTRYFDYQLSQQTKSPGVKQKQQIPLIKYTFQNDSSSQKIQYLSWLDNKTLNFYSIMRIPSQQLNLKGLLYSTNNASYVKVLISLCDFHLLPQKCASAQQINKLLAGGRLFVFIQDQKMNTTYDLASQEDENSYLVHNFFLIPEIYKRVTISFRVEKVTLMPDYFWRWQEQTITRIKQFGLDQQFSDVNANFQNSTALQSLGISFVLHHDIMNTRIVYVTLIDRISMWGALWGVLFALFAFIFLSYNQKKYYRKNPEWNNFKKAFERDGYPKIYT